MEWFEYLIAIAAIGFVFLVIFFHFRKLYLDKKNGKPSCSGCSGNCSHCSGGCINCQKMLEEYRKQKQDTLGSK